MKLAKTLWALSTILSVLVFGMLFAAATKTTLVEMEHVQIALAITALLAISAWGLIVQAGAKRQKLRNKHPFRLIDTDYL